MRPLRSALVLVSLAALPSGCAEEAAPIAPALAMDAASTSPARGAGEGTERGEAEGSLATGTARLVHPASGTATTASTPLFRWTLPEGAAGARVLVCGDRACTKVEQEIRAAGTSARPTRALARGLHFVRVTAIGVYGEAFPSSPAVPVRVRARTNDVDSAWGASADLDGDGFDDLVTTATGDDGRARLVVYRGAASGLAESPSATSASGALPGSVALATAGDVDGDGLSDLLVATVDEQGHGRVEVRLGATDGLVGRVTLSRDAGVAQGGDHDRAPRVEGIGDVDGDGLADVAFVSSRGALVVVRGRASGEDPADVTLPAPAGQRWVELAAAGDLDGDGFADVVARRRGEEAGAASVIEVLRGTATGLASAGPLAAPAGSSSSFGIAFAPAGDVNGDGYADVAVADAPYGAPVRVHVYAGSAAGLAEAPSWTVSGPAWAGNGAPTLSPAGDVDGDGFDDLLVGLPERLFGVATVQPLLPRAALFRGSAAGLAGSAAQTFTLPAGVTDAEGTFGARVAGLGDVDGDGFADVLVGVAQSYPPFFPAVGARRHVFVYRGAAEGTPGSPSASFAGVAGDAAFGRSAASAR